MPAKFQIITIIAGKLLKMNFYGMHHGHHHGFPS
jgi:hypothetical protein